MTTTAPQKLGLLSLTALVAGNMIGSGVFILPADLARVGSISLLSWIFTAGGAFLLALVFSKMSSFIPKAGGPYAYAESSFGEFIGFQTAYTYWVAVWVGNAGITVALIGYLRVFFPQLVDVSLGITVAIAIVLLLTLVNLTGVRSAGAVQVITTVFKLLPLLAVATLGWGYFHPEYITQNFNVANQSNFSAFSHAATLTLWAFIGVESATVPAGAVHNPTRNIPLATLLGTMIAATLYIACSTAVMGMIPTSELVNSTSPFAATAKIIFGPWGEWLVAAGAVISCFGCLNGWILIQGQVAMAAADERLFPTLFAKRNKANVPVWSLIITSTLLCMMLLLTSAPNLVDQFQLIILVAATTTLIAYFYTAMAEAVWLIRHGLQDKSSKIHLVIALLAGVYALWALLGSGKDIIFNVMMLFLSSFPLYALMMWLRQRRRKGKDAL